MFPQCNQIAMYGIVVSDGHPIDRKVMYVMKNYSLGSLKSCSQYASAKNPLWKPFRGKGPTTCGESRCLIHTFYRCNTMNITYRFLVCHAHVEAFV